MEKYKYYIRALEKVGFTSEQAKVMVAIMLDISGKQKFNEDDIDNL